MTIEHARTHVLRKPWGVADPRPWSNARSDSHPIGEVWFTRRAEVTGDPSLLLKLLFTSAPLSIQVHPDDAFARSLDLPSGKTEAWYILNATPEAKVAIGLKQRITSLQLRSAANDGSIADLVAWRTVVAGEVISVPAGTIHAIGAGLVIAEIQQHSDTTFRLFDHGRQRELHIDNAVAVAKTEPAELQAQQNRLTAERTLLVSNSHFAFEKIDLSPNSVWRLQAEHESWLLVIEGSARAGLFDVAIGDALFIQSDWVDIQAGVDGVTALVAYTGGQTSRLLQRLNGWKATDERPRAMRSQSARMLATVVPTDGIPEGKE